MKLIEEKVREILEKKIQALGFELVKVSFDRENKEDYLRITIDKDDNISLDEIENVSNLISPILDLNEDLFKSPYILDVSTLGAEKSIDINKLEKYIGKYVNIHLSHPYKGLNNIIGTLNKVDESNVTIEHQVKSRKNLITLDRKNIDKANLAIKF